MSRHWRYCPLCDKAVVYMADPFETKEKARKELDDRMDEHQLNMCRTCQNDFATCNGKPEFGECVGNDNVIGCASYNESETARW